MSAVFYLSRLPLIGKDDAQGQIAKVPDVMKKSAQRDANTARWL